MSVNNRKDENKDADEAPLLVIGAGIGRTGTMTLKNALEILYGMPCYHMGDMIEKHKDHVKLWSQINDLIERDSNSELPGDLIREIFSGYQLTIGHPGCVIYKQLMELYPGSKVILTIRNPQTWIQSIRETVRPEKASFKVSFLGRLQERLVIAPGFGRMTDQSIRLALGGNVSLADNEQMIRGFLQRIEQVISVVPPDRLLVFEVKDGWEPLCRFLNKPIPDVPFPHVNDRKQMQGRMRRIRMRANAIIFGAVSVCLIAIACSALLISHI